MTAPWVTPVRRMEYDPAAVWGVIDGDYIRLQLSHPVAGQLWERLAESPLPVTAITGLPVEAHS